jgi:hypothetical protein
MGLGQNSPISEPSSWDYCLVAGTECPGWCEVSGWVRSWGWQEKRGKGVQGTTLTYTGKPSAKGTIKFYLTTDEDFEDWDTFYPLFKYDPTRQTIQGIDIKHPALQALGIKACVCEDIGQPEHEGLALWSITVKLIEYAPPPKAPAVATPAGADNGKAGVNAGVGPAPPAPTNPLITKVASLITELGAP